MTQRHQETINKAFEAVSSLKSLLEQSEPSDSWIPVTGVDKCSLAAFAHMHEGVIEEAGRIFGRTGWTETPEASTPGNYKWTKTLDGVELIIYGAKRIETLERPVNPKEFPLQLEDAK